MPATSIAEFDLRKKLMEAFRHGKYFITITVPSEDGKTLEHFFSYQEFKKDDLMPSLSHIAGKVDETAADYS